MERADFHTHSNCSDGELSPIQLLERAADNGVTMLSITDHDTLEAYTDSTYLVAEEKGIVLVPGVEISAVDTDGTKAHILGLGIDPSNERLVGSLADQNLARAAYTDTVVDLLSEAGWHLNSRILRAAETTITKAHIARSVTENPDNKHRLEKIFGNIPTPGAFIEAFLLRGQEFYVSSSGMMTSEEAVAVIHFAGGMACYAHPVASLFEADLDKDALVEKIRSSNVDAVEAQYIYYSKRLRDQQFDMRAEFSVVADELSLFSSGGSDFHAPSSMYGNYVDIGYSNLDQAVQTEIIVALQPLVDRFS